MYSIIDIESNGAGYRKESIIDIAIFKYDGHEILDQFLSLVNPEADITTFVQKLTNISPKMVKTAPKFHEIAKRIIEITQGTTLVGHNIDFDYRMLRQSFQRLGYPYKIETLDTIPLAKKLIPEAESYSLGKLVKSLGIPLTDQHRAGGDARATLELFKILIKKDTQNEIIQAHFEEVNAKTYLNKVRDLTQDLPNERGIVYFQNAEGKMIFSDFVQDINGFSKKIFNSKSKSAKVLQDETEQIRYELVGNAIIAKLLMKSKGLKKVEKQPYGLYHRNGKYMAEKNSLHKTEQALLKFSSFTQALKALNFIKSKEIFNDFTEFTKAINLKKRSELWIFNGISGGQKSFVIFENGKITGYGFFELHTQIKTRKVLDKLKISIPLSTIDVQNDLKLSLLKQEATIEPLPK